MTKLKKFKKLCVLGMATAIAATSLTFSSAASNHGTKTFTFKRDGVETSALCQLYNDAIIRDNKGNMVSTNLYAALMKGVKTSDRYVVYVGYTYYSYVTYAYEYTDLHPEDPGTGQIISSVLTVNYLEEDPMDSRGAFFVNDGCTQMCRHFNDDGSYSGDCSHIQETGVCNFETQYDNQ